MSPLMMSSLIGTEIVGEVKVKSKVMSSLARSQLDKRPFPAVVIDLQRMEYGASQFIGKIGQAASTIQDKCSR